MGHQTIYPYAERTPLQPHCIYTRQLRQHGFSHMFFFVPWQERLTLV